MSESKKVWPIKSETSCYLKWSWSTIYIQRATTASCHRTTHIDFDLDEFDNFHNLEKKVDDRRRMLAGGWPAESELDYVASGCTYCKYLEDRGGVSDRQVQMRNLPLAFQNHENVLPPELIANPEAVEVTPTIVEVYFNNICNMGCLYCGPHFSSIWEEENRRFNVTKDTGILVNPTWRKDEDRYHAMVDKLFAWLREHGHKIWNFGMLGGEPFFQKEFDMVLDHWDNYPNPDLLLTVVTNLKVEHERFKSYIDRFKQMIDAGKIKSVNISCSLDCWGPQIEYVRYGLSLEQWQQNFEYMLDKDWIVLNINAAITPLTIKTLPEFVEKINEWDQIRLLNTVAKNLKIPYDKISGYRERIMKMIADNKIPQADIDKHITFSFMHVLEPMHMNPLWFGPGVFTEDMQRVLDCMPETTDYQRNYKNYMSGIARSIETNQRDPAMILKLEKYLTEMDRRRHTDWRTLFPWLEDEFARARQELAEKYNHQ